MPHHLPASPYTAVRQAIATVFFGEADFVFSSIPQCPLIPLNLPSHPSHEFIAAFPDLLDFGQTGEVGGIPHGDGLQGGAVEAVGAIGGAHHTACHIHYRKFAIRQRKEQDAIAKIHRRRMVDARASPLVVEIRRLRRNGLQK